MKKIIIFLLKYLFNILVGIFDQGLNTVLFGATDETVSSRTGRAYRSGNYRWFVPYIYHSLNFIFKIIKRDKNHCVSSIEHGLKIKNELWSWIKTKKQ